jgi:hypothetical protein
MNLVDELKKIADEINGSVEDKKGEWVIKAVIAERKAFLSKKKLTYIAKIKIDEANKEAKFSEMLMEQGSGFSSGGSDGMSTGFGFKTESYNTMSGERKGNIEEQSNLFGKTYQYNFDYSNIREKVKKVVEDAGYKYSYHII